MIGYFIKFQVGIVIGFALVDKENYQKYIAYLLSLGDCNASYLGLRYTHKNFACTKVQEDVANTLDKFIFSNSYSYYNRAAIGFFPPIFE